MKSKNKCSKQLIIGGAIAAVGILLISISVLISSNATTENEAATAFFGNFLLGGLLLLAVGAIWYVVALNNSRKYCDKCGGSMEGCEYQYQEVSRAYQTDYLKTKTNINVMKHVVEIIAVCPECGATKVFRKTFKVNSGENVQYAVDNFCRSKFGH